MYKKHGKYDSVGRSSSQKNRHKSRHNVNVQHDSQQQEQLDFGHYEGRHSHHHKHQNEEEMHHHHRHHYHRHRNHDKYDNYEKNREKISYHERRSVSPKLFYYTRKESEKERLSKDRKGVSDGYKRRHHSAHSTTNISKKPVTKDLYLDRAKTFIGNSLHTSPHRQLEKKEKHRSRSERKSSEKDRVSQIWYCQVDANSPFKSNKKIPEKFKTERYPKIRHERGTSTSKYKEMPEKDFLKYVFNLNKSKSHHSRDPNVNLLTKPDRKDHVSEHTTKIDQKSQTREKYIQADTKTQKISDDVDKKIQDGMNVYFTKLQQLIDEKFNAFLKFNNTKYRTVESNKLSREDKINSIEHKKSADIKKISTGNKHESIETKTRSVERKMENPDYKIIYETRKEKKKSHKSSQNEEQNKHLNIEQVKYQNDKYQNVPRNRILNSKEGYRRINNQNDIQNYLVTVPHESEKSGHQTYRVSSPKPTEYRQNSVISIDIKSQSKNKEINKKQITISKPDDYSAHKTLKPKKDKKHDKYCGLKREQQCLPSSNCQNIIRDVMLGNIVGAPSTSLVHVKPNDPISTQHIKPHSEISPKKKSNKYKDKETNFWVEGIEPANMDTTSKHKKRNLVQNLECKTVSVIGIPSQIKHKPRQEEKAIVPIDEMLEKKNRMKRFQLYYQYSLGKNRPKSANATTRSAISESMKVLSEQSLLTNGESHSTTTKKNVKIDNRKYITNRKTCDGTTLINIRLDDFHNYYLQGNKRDTSVTIVENIKDKITGKVNSTKVLKNDQPDGDESTSYKQLNEDIFASNSNIELSHNDVKTKHNSEDTTVKEFYRSIDFFQRAFEAKIPENNVTNNQILQFLENMHQLYLTNKKISQSEIKEEKINSKNDKENNSFDERFTFNSIEQQTSVDTVKKKSEMTGTSKKRKKHKSVYTNLLEDTNNNKICNDKVDKMTSYQDLNQLETIPDSKNVTTTNDIKDCIIQTDFSHKCVHENKKPKQDKLQNKNKNNEQKNEATQSEVFLDYLKKCSLSQSTQTRIQTRDNVTETITFNKLDQSKKNNCAKIKKKKLTPILEKKVKIEEDKNKVIRKKRSYSPSKSSVVSCPVGKSQFESSDNFKLTKSQSEINFENNGSIDDGSQTNAQSLDQFLSSNKSNSSRLMLTKEYRTGDVSAYQKRKRYGNLIRKKMKKKSPRDKSMEQIFEVRYLTLEDNLLKSSYDNIAEFILQSLQHNSESKFKENDLNTIKLYDFLNQVSNFPLEDDSKDNLLNCKCCAAGKNFMNFVNYLCNILKSNCNPVQQIDKDPTFTNPKNEIGDLHIQTNALKNGKVNISEDTKNLNLVGSEKNLRKKKVNLLHRSATDNSMFHTGNIYEDFHSAETSSCPALRTIDSSFDFLYQDYCIRSNKGRLLVPILGFVSKKVKNLRRQESPGSETSGYASSRSKQSCSFLNFFKRPKIAALLKPQTEEGIYGNAVGSLDNKPDILTLELSDKPFQEVSISLLQRASSFTFGNSSSNFPFDNVISDSCNLIILRKTASDTNLLFKELFLENVGLEKTLDVQFINTSLGISNPSISSDDLSFNADTIHYVSIFEKILTSEVYMDMTNLSSCSITLVESEFSTDQSLLSLQNTNYNEYSTTEITTLITRKFFENIVEMYDKETALSCALYENKDFINNELLPSIRSEDDKTVNKKKRPLSSRIKSVIKKIISGNRTIKANEEMIHKLEPVENEYQNKLQALAHNAHRYFSSLIDLNVQNKDEMKYYGILRLIEAIEKGRFKFLKKFKSLFSGTNLELEIQDQVKNMFINVHSFANLEAEKCHRKLTENDLKLIGAFVCKYRIGLIQGIELIATNLGKGFFKTESQLKAAVTYLLKTPNKVDLQDFEQFCESIE